MKKITFLLFITIFFGGIINAQNSDRKWAIGIGPGADLNLNNGLKYSNEKNAMLNFYLSRYLNSSFDLMLGTRISFYGDNYFWKKTPEGESYIAKGIDIVNPLLNLRYKFNNGYIFKENSSIQPYLLGGLGYMWDNRASGVNFDLGVGVKVPISQNTSIFVTTSYVNRVEAGTAAAAYRDDHLQLTGMIEFALGKAKDSDGDGVKDKKDE